MMMIKNPYRLLKTYKDYGLSKSKKVYFQNQDCKLSLCMIYVTNAQTLASRSIFNPRPLHSINILYNGKRERRKKEIG